MSGRIKSLFQRWPFSLRDQITNVIVLAIILSGVIERATIYGDFGLSVAHMDTHAYIASSEVNLLSWKAFTSDLPFTTNLIFQIFKPDRGYALGRVSSTSTGTISRRDRPGFHSIAIFQSILSMLVWASLAWIFSSKLKNPIMRILSSGVIVLFGFTPQIADWDSVMGTESLSISLFVLAFAILVELAFQTTHRPKLSLFTIIFFILFFVSIFLWTFVRDVNPYAMVFLQFFIWGLYILPKFRRKWVILIAGSLISLLFILGVLSVRQRPPIGRTLNVIWEIDIMPFPARAQFFFEHGMPEQDSPEFQEWFDRHADYTYMLFLLNHPGYTILNYFQDMNFAFLENMQPYFIARDLPYRKNLIILGNYLHPVSASVFVLICTLFVPILIWTFKKSHPVAPVWLWLLTWAFLTAAMTLFLSIFGVPLGLQRHALSSTVTFRLLMWCLLFIVIDLSLQLSNKDHNEINASVTPDSQPLNKISRVLTPPSKLFHPSGYDRLISWIPLLL